MKKFTLMLVAGLFALAGSVQAQKKVVISAEDTPLAEDGTAVINVNLSYPTTEQLVGYNFSLMLPEGVTANTKTGKMTAAAFGLSEDIHPLLYDANADDYTFAATKSALQVKDKADGGTLIIWIDQNEQTPLLKTEGQLMTIKIKAAEGFVSGQGMIYTAGVSAVIDGKSVSLDLGNIEDVPFIIGSGSEGINDIKNADATAPAYNLQGVRVNSAAKGVIIRDGKKMVVK